MTWFSDIIRHLYISDFFDVLVIALLIYSALILFKQTRSLLILIGVGIILVLYAFAEVFNLYLTSIVLRSFFSVFLIVLAVMFQEELRRFFEFIAALGTRQNRKSRPLTAGSRAAGDILQAVGYLAHQRIGALIVVRGKENIDRHIRGGKILDGIISEDIMVDIFDPSSPGHDGAMIISRDRIMQFGAYLPLSSNFREIGRHGTRHSAALGISEETDALAIAVSEETGAISITEHGKLHTIKTLGELEARLEYFLEETRFSFVENAIRKNVIEKILAALFAVFLWFTFGYRADTVQRLIVLPISYRNVPENFTIEDSRPKELTVTFESRGASAFDRIDALGLEIAIDAGNIVNGVNAINVTDEMIKRPNNFSVVKIDPVKIRLVVKKLEPIRAPQQSSTQDFRNSKNFPRAIFSLI